jgi:acyl carrier protein
MARATDEARWKRQGWTLIPSEIGKDLFGRLLRSTVPQVGVLPVDWELAGQDDRGERPLLTALMAAARRTDRVAQAFDVTRALCIPPHERYRMVEAYLLELLRRVLAVSSVNPDEPITQLGLDSLMALELRNRIERDTGVSVSATSLLDSASVRGVTRSVVEGLPRSRNASRQLQEHLDDLADDVVDALLTTLDATPGTVASE